MNERLGFRRVERVLVRPNEITRHRLVLRKGQLRFEARPWADIFVDGKKVGTTPLLPVSLWEGLHEVRFVNRRLGRDTRLEVDVQAGRVTRIRPGWNKL